MYSSCFEAILYNFRLGTKVVKEELDHPFGPKWLHYTKFKINRLDVGALLKLIANFIGVPFMKLLPQKVFGWLVHTDVQRLKPVCCVSRNHNKVNAVVFK